MHNLELNNNDNEAEICINKLELLIDTFNSLDIGISIINQ